VYIKSFRMLFALDLFIILVSGVLGYAFLKGIIPVWPDFLNIDRDWSAGETLSYVKWVLMALVFSLAYMRKRETMFLSLVIAVLILLADDSMQLHETYGPNVVQALRLYDIFGSAASTVGPLFVWAALGVGVLTSVLIGWRTASRELKRALYPVFGLFFAVVFFAVGIDAVHELVTVPKVIQGVLGIVEDGGEMLVMTALLRYVWMTFHTQDSQSHSAVPAQ